ncbi:MAG: HPF/RaiA family ribosome-associated protein [Gemmatimonadetes bacterium]|nr:HPF/RaiA family ribosome-associated protein [Gemmatimonadota bacterium]
MSELLRKRSEDLAGRWPRFDPAVMDMQLIFRHQGRSHTVEAIVSRRRRQPAVAKGEGPDFRVALDELDGHVKRILKRDRSRRKDFRHATGLPG